MMACVSTYILTLIEFVIVLHILLKRLTDRVVLIIIHYVSISDILSMDTASSLNQRKLLGV